MSKMGPGALIFKPGELAERSNAAVLKTASPQGLGGSNPSLSARTCPSKSHEVPEAPISLYENREGVLTRPHRSGTVRIRSVGRNVGRIGRDSNEPRNAQALGKDGRKD